MIEEKITFEEEGKTFSINGKNIVLKGIEDHLYIDDKEIDFSLPKDRNGEYYVYVSDYLIFVFGAAQDMDTLRLILDENGKEVNIINNKSIINNLFIPYRIVN